MEDGLFMVILVFAVLQIILFFKVWGMTNDVNKIRNKILVSESYNNLVKEIVKGNPEIANLLFEAVYSEYYKIYSLGEKQAKFKAVQAKYMPLYDRAGISFPECLLSINNRSDFREIFIINVK